MRALGCAGIAAALIGCGRVPEAQLRDEQSRARRYRDAYETALGENQELRKRLSAAEQKPAVCPAPEPAQPKPAEPPK